MRAWSRLLDLARRLLEGRPLRDRPMTEEDRVPLRGLGRYRDPGHRPESQRASCGRPRPGDVGRTPLPGRDE